MSMMRAATMLPREEQAKLADFVTVANCSRPGWCRGAGLFGSGNFELWNVTYMLPMKRSAIKPSNI